MVPCLVGFFVVGCSAGSLLGNASTATSATSATTATTASYVLQAVSASFASTATTASYWSGSTQYAVTAGTAATASYWSGSTQYAVTAGTAATASSIGTLVQAVTISGSLNTTGSTTFNGPFNGVVISASIASSTASLDFSTGNFYTSLVSGSTNFNITNPKVGQTVNVLLTTVASATASFSSNVKQPSGSSYTPTTTAGAKDILTFISWDGTTVYLANVKNLI